MKKTLIVTLALVFVLSIGSAAFAAANPFVDVPAKHWAYDAVSKLAQAGIVDGYNDGTFRGDKTMTRYEMAQIVAKAMARSDKASAENKALVDKLAVEFAAELQNLGVRVAKLEANQSNLKFTGDLRVRWQNTEGMKDGDMFKDRFRLNMTSQINDNTSLYARFVFQDDRFNQDAHQRLSDMALTTKGLINNTDVTVGRYTLNLGPTGWFSGTTGDIDGIMTNTKSGNFGLMLGYAQIRDDSINSLQTPTRYTAAYNYAGSKWAIKNIEFAEGTYQMDKAKINVDFFKNVNHGGYDNAATTASGSIAPGNVVLDYYNIFGGGLTYTFDSNWKFIGEYYRNTASMAKSTFHGDTPTATIARVAYKGANALKPGSWGMYAEYTKFEGNSLPYALEGPFMNNNGVSFGLDTMNGVKMYNTEVDYTLAKNVVFNAMYQFNVKDAVTGQDAPSKSFTRAQINYFF